ncbi:MAG TPA: L-aspartate oxidase, partial [Kofleriaceae bacterium]|nr:L-aspartate oxidase [Kofleriaceae bacterium]
MAEPLETDYLVIGSGIAGLNFALLAAEHGRVVVITKKQPDDTNTNWAQGGVAAVLSPKDSFEQHIQDTLVAGDGLCDRDVVERCVVEGPAQVQRLLDIGVRLARGPDGALDLGREGAHTHNRVVHWQDVTGREIQRALLEAVGRSSNITVLHDHIAVDLLSMAKYGGDPACFGAYVLDRARGEVVTILARATLLATGGTGKVYVYTSNPDVATGDGVAMAYRLGAACCDLEFVQFHPTVLYHPHARNFLLTEAMRGEGGVLRLATGESFMEHYHPMKSLASRDIVARAIDNELKKSGSDSVFLDMTQLDAGFVRGRFPNIYERCLGLGIDITRQPIPVVPAAHYMCGGVKTDRDGQTTIGGLYAIGECAFTGLHGANRLASNSLLEGMVYSTRAAAAVRDAPRLRPSRVAPWSSGDATDSNDAIVVTLNWDEIRRFMWSYLGIMRSDKRIERARRRIEILRDEIREYYMDFKITSDLIELRNLALVAHLIIESARRRKESRGLHSTLDYPN